MSERDFDFNDAVSIASLTGLGARVGSLLGGPVGTGIGAGAGLTVGIANYFLSHKETSPKLASRPDHKAMVWEPNPPGLNVLGRDVDVGGKVLYALWKGGEEDHEDSKRVDFVIGVCIGPLEEPAIELAVNIGGRPYRFVRQVPSIASDDTYGQSPPKAHYEPEDGSVLEGCARAYLNFAADGAQGQELQNWARVAPHWWSGNTLWVPPWSASHRLNGIAWIHLILNLSEEGIGGNRFSPNGKQKLTGITSIPSVSFRIPKGRTLEKVPDAGSSDTDPVAGSRNSARAALWLLRDYIDLDDKYIDLDSARNAEARCADEQVRGSYTIGQFDISGVVEETDEPLRLLQTLETTWNGFIGYQDGQVVQLPGDYARSTPKATHVLGPSDLVGDVDIVTTIRSSDRYNTVSMAMQSCRQSNHNGPISVRDQQSGPARLLDGVAIVESLHASAFVNDYFQLQQNARTRAYLQASRLGVRRIVCWYTPERATWRMGDPLALTVEDGGIHSVLHFVITGIAKGPQFTLIIEASERPISDPWMVGLANTFDPFAEVEPALVDTVVAPTPRDLVWSRGYGTEQSPSTSDTAVGEAKYPGRALSAVTEIFYTAPVVPAPTPDAGAGFRMVGQREFAVLPGEAIDIVLPEAVDGPVNVVYVPTQVPAWMAIRTSTRRLTGTAPDDFNGAELTWSANAGPNQVAVSTIRFVVASVPDQTVRTPLSLIFSDVGFASTEVRVPLDVAKDAWVRMRYVSTRAVLGAWSPLVALPKRAIPPSSAPSIDVTATIAGYAIHTTDTPETLGMSHVASAKIQQVRLDAHNAEINDSVTELEWPNLQTPFIQSGLVAGETYRLRGKYVNVLGDEGPETVDDVTALDAGVEDPLLTFPQPYDSFTADVDVEIPGDGLQLLGAIADPSLVVTEDVPFYETVSLGVDSFMAGVWSGAVQLDGSLMMNGQAAWLRRIYTLHIGQGLTIINTSAMQDAAEGTAGPDFVASLETSERFMTFSEAGRDDLVLRGPYNDQVVSRDDTEPYTYGLSDADHTALENWLAAAGTNEVFITFDSVRSTTRPVVTQYSIVGDLPDGMAFDPVTRRLTGTPIEAGFYNFQLRATLGDHTATMEILLLVRSAGEMELEQFVYIRTATSDVPDIDAGDATEQADPDFLPAGWSRQSLQIMPPAFRFVWVSRRFRADVNTPFTVFSPPVIVGSQPIQERQLCYWIGTNLPDPLPAQSDIEKTTQGFLPTYDGIVCTSSIGISSAIHPNVYELRRTYSDVASSATDWGGTRACFCLWRDYAVRV